MDRSFARIEYSRQRILFFRQHISTCQELNHQKNLCIYTTGSYGRLEACEHSDLDLFFLSDSSAGKISKISKTLIDAHIISVSRSMQFPEFSGDGTYLEIHSTDEIYNELGSRKDDFYNFFTARMLLLLESRPLHNAEMYDSILKSTLERYYTDFNEHEQNFQPIFLVNDILRFWRTICLNYEHNRNRRTEQFSNKELAHKKKNKAHIKNLKLKFSRKLTCYSFLLRVLYHEEILDQQGLLEIIKQTPFDRLHSLLQYQGTKVYVNEIINLYLWFLKTTQTPEDELLAWISQKQNRDMAFDRSRKFGKAIFSLMMNVENKDKLMYFLV